MKKAFVLGGTVPHKELIKQLKGRGFYVTLIDYSANPPAKNEANDHIMVSTLDKDGVLRLAKEQHVDLVISSCIDQANSIACYVGEQLGLPHPYSYEKSLDVTRKGRMKTIFRQSGVPTSDFYILEKSLSRDIKLPYPFVIKPTDANSSKGVFRIDTKEEFEEKIEQSFSFSREKKVIVESFVRGVEVQVDCVAVDGKAFVLMTNDKEALSDSGFELQVVGFSIPGEICDKYKAELHQIAQRIVDGFGLKNTPFFYQAICNDQGVWVLEFAPRIAGGTRFETVQMFSGYDYIKASINSFLNEPLESNFTVSTRRYVVRHLYMKPGVFSHIEGLDVMLQTKEISQYFPFVVKGKEISASMNSGNRVGAVMVEAGTYEEAEQRLKVVFSKLKLIDADGKDKSFWRD